MVLATGPSGVVIRGHHEGAAGMGPDCTGRVKPLVGSQLLCLSFPISKQMGLWWRLSKVCRSHSSEQRQLRPHPSRCPHQQNVGGSPLLPPFFQPCSPGCSRPRPPTQSLGWRVSCLPTEPPLREEGEDLGPDRRSRRHRRISRGDCRSRAPPRGHRRAVWPCGRSPGCARALGHLAGRCGAERPWGGCRALT